MTILDANGNPISSVDEQFESFSSGDTFDSLKGGSEQVLGEAFALDTGRALTEKDLFTEGTYPIHHVPGQYILLAHKKANGEIRFESRVYTHAEEAFREELRLDREYNENAPKEQKVKYNVPPWIMAMLLFEHDVAPGGVLNDLFELRLYENYPECWLDQDRAPKR